MLRSVLVVDDHAGFRRAARAVLADEFTVVAEADDLEGALDAARRWHPDIALVDIGLVDEDGFAVTEALLAADASLQVILVSSRHRTEVATRLRDSSARGFITKDELTPARLTELLDGGR